MTSESYIQIAPSVLAADFSRLGQQVRDATAAGADLIHVDIMDGCFVPNISFGEVVVDAIRRSTHLPLNIHLMVQEPDGLLPSFMKSPSDQIIVHAEACTRLHLTYEFCSRSLTLHRGSSVGRHFVRCSSSRFHLSFELSGKARTGEVSADKPRGSAWIRHSLSAVGS